MKCKRYLQIEIKQEKIAIKIEMPKASILQVEIQTRKESYKDKMQKASVDRNLKQ